MNGDGETQHGLGSTIGTLLSGGGKVIVSDLGNYA